MKLRIMLAALALSLGAANAQPPEVAKPNQPTAEQQAKWQREWEEQQREELRHPGSMIKAFADAMNVSNFERAALCVAGAQSGEDLNRWRRSARDAQGNWYLNITPLFQDAQIKSDAFTARVAMTFGLRDATIDHATEKLLLTRIETVDVRREGENWKIVPRPLPKVAPDENVDYEDYQAWQIKNAEAQISTARNENDGILNDWARLMAKSPTEMKQHLAMLSQSNVKQLLLGTLQLTQDYDEVYHFNADNWVEMLGPYVHNKNLFQMPDLENEKPATYAINSALFEKPLAAIAQPARTVAIYESGDRPRSLNYQYDGQAVVGFADGHVEMVGPDDLPKLIWEIKPPPSG